MPPYKLHTWLRYIDDIFAVRQHDRHALKNFIHALNDIKPRLKFTAKIHDTQAIFLNVKVFQGTLFDTLHIFDTSIHYKSTNNFQYVLTQTPIPSTT